MRRKNVKSTEAKSTEVKSSEAKNSNVKIRGVKSSDVKSTVNTNRIAEATFSVLLSREEVLAILAVMKLGAIPYLGQEAIPDLSPEQRAYGLIVAERSLRARGLAGIDQAGRIRFPHALLDAVGSCALANRSLFVSQMGTQKMSASQFVVHQAGRGASIHTPLDGTIHQFAWNEHPADAASQIAKKCGLVRTQTVGDGATSAPKSQLQGLSMTVGADALKTITESARAGDGAKAVLALLNQGFTSADAQALTGFLASPHMTTVMQDVTLLAHSSRAGGTSRNRGTSPTRSSQDPSSVAIQSATFWHNEREVLVVSETEPNGTNRPQRFHIQPATLNDAHQHILALLSSV